MPTFIYQARDRLGSPIRGAVESSDKRAVALSLKRLGYSVIQVEEESRLQSVLGRLAQQLRHTTEEEIVILTRQLSAMIRSGITLSEALSAVAEQTRNTGLREVVAGVRRSIEEGKSFSESLARHPKVFSELYVSMIRVGESAGILEAVLERLAALGQKELEIKSKIKASATYPVILVVLMMVVVGFLLTGVLPRFISIFEAYGERLPFSTRILLAFSSFLRRFGYLLVGLLALMILGLRSYRRSERGRYNLDYLILKFPVLGNLFLKTMVSRFARSLSSLTHSGIPILNALNVVEKTIPNMVMNRVVANIRSSLAEGEGLSGLFRASGLFPTLVCQMISVGEKTGRLDEMLEEVANFYDLEVDYAIRRLTTFLEPGLLLIMGGLVLFIALSVLLPIFNLVQIFG